LGSAVRPDRIPGRRALPPAEVAAAVVLLAVAVAVAVRPLPEALLGPQLPVRRQVQERRSPRVQAVAAAQRVRLLQPQAVVEPEVPQARVLVSIQMQRAVRRQEAEVAAAAAGVAAPAI